MTREITVKFSELGTATDAADGILRMEPSYAKTGDAFLGIDAKSAYAYLSPAEARKMGEWLATRYGVGGYEGAKAGETVKVVGQDGKLKRTAVVDGEMDSDGEYSVRGEGYVSAALIRHADAILPEDETPPAPAAPSFAAGTPVVITSNDAQDSTGFRAGLAKGTPVVVDRRVSGNAAGRSYVVKALHGGRLTEFFVRPQDIAASLPAEAPTPLAVGQVRVLKAGAQSVADRGTAFTGMAVTRVRLVEDMGDGDWRVEEAGGRSGALSGLRQSVGASYLGELVEAAPAPVTPQVGGEYAVKPDARAAGGTSTLAGWGATRVRVVSGPDFDGDLWVKALDGRQTGRHAYVLPSGLAALPAVKTGPLTVSEEAVFAERYGSRFRVGDRVRVTRTYNDGFGNLLVGFKRLSDGETGECYARRLRRA